MIHTDRWAAAFIGVLGSKAEVGFVCLKNLTALLKPIHGALFGRSMAKFIEESLSKEFTVQKDHSEHILVEHMYPIRFICLLIEKNIFCQIDAIILKIEQLLDKKNGVLKVVVETALPEDKNFEDKLAQMIRVSTGAVQVKMHMTVLPELLAGYRLRMDGHYIDVSLKEQLEQMTAELLRGA
jgi:F0F1-type ATP synthase delta subunit